MASLRKNKHDLYSDVLKIRDALADTGQDVKNIIGDTYHQSLDNIKETSVMYKDVVTDYIVEHPFKSLGMSMLSGFVIGYMLKKKK